ncbi:tetratricopeptide repeat protein [Mesonia maritima]|uniref:Tetratricopeptide (TPR) repeat protein n=1 Tax=Mesonia maritima TaxID=1793873 RepID=A0ABU1K2M0_9FLAO|nr:tetratricopeptide repeat protein [Mesonia maritima]MDR6299854.1 tetratricopeptide (TPR) repeat protein [Mesonia maritima]
MKIHRFYIHFFFLFGIIFIPQHAFSQKENDTLAIAKGEVNQDDLGNVTDKFQEYFFEALKQKAIENYEKAISALKQCEKLRPNEPVVWFELGKNYKALKDFTNAEEYFKQTLAEKPKDQQVLVELFDVYFQTQNYTSAIEIAKKLTAFEVNYYEDLANLYMLTKSYTKALEALDVIDAKQGASEYRDDLRRKIYLESDDKNGQVAYLEDKIETDPDNKQNYLNLIYFYSETGAIKKAYEVAQKLREIYPDAAEAHLALYKIYIEEGELEKAVESMKIVLNSEMISEDIKQKVIKDFTQFVQKNPQFENQLVSVLGEELNYGEQSNKQLGEYYIGNDNSKAISYLKKALDENPSDFEVIKKLLLLQIKEKQFEDALALSDRTLAVFPTQPIIYLLQGVSFNETEQFKKAEESLLTGLDFLIENPQMEADFYQQLIIAYNALGNQEKLKKYQEKAATLKK